MYPVWNAIPATQNPGFQVESCRAIKAVSQSKKMDRKAVTARAEIEQTSPRITTSGNTEKRAAFGRARGFAVVRRQV